VSAGHFGRQFRLAYGESPYAYLMTGASSAGWCCCVAVTEVCFAVGCSSLGTFSTPLHRAGRHAAQRLSPPRGDAPAGGDAVVRGQTRDEADQESRSLVTRGAPSMTAMDITIHSTFNRLRLVRRTEVLRNG
jgi:hypothetical protein